MARKTLHLLCNAHIDPVWLWEWPEGAGEALSSFRTAADLCETHPGFVFCHNEALLYQWVEAYEPVLFSRIRKLVRRGRWSILGGWFLQPDGNMPGGESFVRQILLGKRYFQRAFGIEVKTAANLDSFGHARGLVQILAKSGFEAYLFCRPDKTFARLPAAEFVWVGYDGSKLMAARAEAHYNSRGGAARSKVEAWMRDHPEKDLGLVLWGVGDHGGGASRRDLEDLEALRRATRREWDVRHSTADVYFAALGRNKSRLPLYTRSLNPWAVGCYTTMARVKQGHRKLENEFFMAEKMASAAAFQGLSPYPSADLAEAQRDLAFSEFHDILPGSSVPAGEEGALRLLGHGLEIASRVKARAFFALAAGEPRPAEGEIPLFVYNPHPFSLRTIIEAEFQAHEPNEEGGFLFPRVFQNGRALPTQPEKEGCNLSLEWRKRAAFEARLAPGRMNRFVCRMERIGARPRPDLSLQNGRIRVDNSELEVIINTATGLIDRYRVGGADILGPGAFRPLVMADNADPWGMRVVRFRRPAGRFRLATSRKSGKAAGVSGGILPAVRGIEDGAVRTIIESCLVYGESVTILRYKLPKRGTEVEVEVRVLWAEKDRMLKLSLPTRWLKANYVGQTAYGRDELPANGDEAVAQKWTAVVSPDGRRALTCINDGTYGSDFKNGELRLSLLRSPAYAADPAEDRPLSYQDRFIPRIDQGEHLFRFWINAGPAEERLNRVDNEALSRNEAPHVLAYFPPGDGPASRPFLTLSDKSVQVTALKKAEDSGALIIRLFEPTGRRRTISLALPFAGLRTRITLRPFEIKTLAFDPATKTFTETDLLERPLIEK